MNAKTSFLCFLLSLTAATVSAQKRKPAKSVQPVAQVAVVEETPAQHLFKAMLPATAKVMFIDSIVVEKENFFKQIPLSAEAGQILSYEDFFNCKTTVPLTVYKNGFGDRCYYADGDTLSTSLYTIDLLGNKWSKSRRLTELEAGFPNLNYPFLMSDGITLFFAAEGENSLGGYDIFTTLYDAESDSYYKPENYGLPFNSTANDYLVAFDETNELGFLVSDRYQPAGYVCIYVFEPTMTRQSFEGDNISDGQLRRLAEIKSIRDTWAFGNRKAAIERLALLREQARQVVGGKPAGEQMAFVVNDRTVYRQIGEFKSPQSRELYRQLAQLEAQTETERQTLEMQREKYARSAAREQQLMQQAMLRLEHKIDESEEQIIKLQKEIRYIENRILSDGVQ